MDEKQSILIVDDDEGNRKTLTFIFGKNGYETETAGTGQEAIDKALRRFFNLAILDIKLPDVEGVELLAPLKEMHPDMAVIMVTAYASIETALRALNEGASAYITKPMNMDAVLATIKDALEKQRLVRDNRRLYQEAQRELAERKRAEAALRESETNFRNLITKNADGIIIIDRNGIVRFVNPATEALFGQKAETLVGQSFGFPVVASETTEIQVTLKRGETAKAEMRTVEMKWEGEIAYLASLRDITERSKIEQMKSDFVSLVSHQLKTPVAQIKGYIDNMLAGLTGGLTAEQEQYLQEMQEVSSRNYRLISDLLSVSRIERGVISADIQPVKLREIVDLAVRDYRPSIEKKGLTLNLNGTDSEVTALADKGKTVEALGNVINNAVKFTDEGSITVEARSEDGFAIVEVADTGKGISEALLNKLFKKDQVLDGSPTTEGSSGLGLYIAKEFMRLQHGDISVTSVVGKGSSFILKFPSAEAD